MKKRIFSILFVIFVVIVAGVVWRAIREGVGQPIIPDSSLPKTNPFEVESNPFDFYKNPFDSSRLDAFLLFAQADASRISFPVAELGNCESRRECRAYCNGIGHISECLDFAEKHNLLPSHEIEQGRKFAAAGGVGPGGCTRKEACDAYCGNLEHIEECVRFAEKHGILPPEELNEARRIARYVGEGGKMPGGCTKKSECMAYCGVREHIEECIAFAERAGVLPPDELAQAKKVLPYLIRGETPGGCVSKEECDAYCMGVLEHMEECLAFAEKAGLIPSEELRIAKKVVPFMVRGETPGKCLSKEACEAYCRDFSHLRECLDFAEKIGILGKVEVTLLRQLLKLAPGQ